jgi:hypothetical protein
MSWQLLPTPTSPTRATTPTISLAGISSASKYYSRKLGTNVARRSAPSAYGVHSNKLLSANSRSLCNSPICQFFWTVVRLFTEHARRVSSMSLPNAPLISMATDPLQTPPTSSRNAPSSMRTPRSNSHPSISSKFVIKVPHCFIRLRRQIYSSGTVLNHHDATRTSLTTMLQQPATLSTKCTVTHCDIDPLYSCQILPSPPPFSIPVMMSACDPPT